jgi:hypothetical protein
MKPQIVRGSEFLMTAQMQPRPKKRGRFYVETSIKPHRRPKWPIACSCRRAR